MRTRALRQALSRLLDAEAAPLTRELGSQVNMFIGPRAKTWNQSAALAAKRMEREGARPDEIWRETGTFRGADKKWRQEIDDSDSEALMGARSDSAKNKLRHDALYEAYPGLAKIRVKSADADGAGGYALIAPFYREIGYDVPRSEARSTLLHEMQHMTQAEEGFAGGGNKMVGKISALFAGDRGRYLNGGEAYRRLMGEVEARQVQARADLTPEQRREHFPMTVQAPDFGGPRNKYGQEYYPEEQLDPGHSQRILQALAGLGGAGLAYGLTNEYVRANSDVRQALQRRLNGA